MRLLISTITIMLLLIIISCTTSSVIITGNTRPAIDSTEVTIYLDPPSKYETIGMIEALSDIEISAQAAQDRVINELKKQAAKIGANGILLLNAGTDSTGTTVYNSGGNIYTSTSKTKI